MFCCFINSFSTLFDVIIGSSLNIVCSSFIDDGVNCASSVTSPDNPCVNSALISILLFFKSIGLLSFVFLSFFFIFLSFVFLSFIFLLLFSLPIIFLVLFLSIILLLPISFSFVILLSISSSFVFLLFLSFVFLSFDFAKNFIVIVDGSLIISSILILILVIFVSELKLCKILSVIVFFILFSSSFSP